MSHADLTNVWLAATAICGIVFFAFLAIYISRGRR